MQDQGLFVVIAFLAGILSVLAPCIIGMLPVLIARSVESKKLTKTINVIAGLAFSIFIFSILLKATTIVIGIPQSVWRIISGAIIILFGLSSLFPEVWEKIASRLKFQQISAKGQKSALQQKGFVGDILLGASFGPIFSACSPTYVLIVAAILPASSARGMVYLLVFILGLTLAILAVVFAGQKLVKKMGWSINPNGWFKRTLGLLFIIIGLMLITGFDKTLQTKAVENGWFDWQVNLEQKLQR